MAGDPRNRRAWGGVVAGGLRGTPISEVDCREARRCFVRLWRTQDDKVTARMTRWSSAASVMDPERLGKSASRGKH